MTALQSIIKEAKAIRKKNPKMEWKKAVAQASAIYASKHKGKSPVGKKHAVKKKAAKKKAVKKVGVIKKKVVRKTATKKAKRKPTEKTVYKAIKKAVSVQKAHMGSVSEKAMHNLKEVMHKIHAIEKQIENHKVAIKKAINKDHKTIYKRQLVGLKKYLSELKTHAREVKKHI